MYLKLFKNMTRCVEFNGDLRNLGEAFYLENRRTCGFAYVRDNFKCAVYAGQGTIFFGIENDVWDILSPNTFVDYFHIYDRRCTYFKVTDGCREYENTYSSWWADRADCLQFEGDLLVEDDIVEDFFGYVAAIKSNRKMADNLFELWAKNAI